MKLAAFRKSAAIDWLNILWIGLLGLALSAYMLQGEVLTTTYSDWIYHAFRAQSLLQHGFVSWDNIGNNGLSYWRGYQFIPAMLTALLAGIGHLTPARAMIIISVVLFVFLHITVYLSLRIMGQNKLTAIVAALLTFLFSGYWLELKDYSIAFGAVLLPLILALWHSTLRRPQLKPYFAASIGLSVYVHPLLAVGLGGLWVSTLFIMSDRLKPWELIRDGLLFISCSFFYVATLRFADQAFIAPYIMAKDFTYVLFGSFQPGAVFLFALIGVGLVFAFRSKDYDASIKILYWYCVALFVIVQLSEYTNLVDGLNRFQPIRLLFFISIGIYMAAGQVLARGLPLLRKLPRDGILALLVGMAIAQSLIDSSVYGSYPSSKLPDPVGQFLSGRPVSGTIHIADSTTSSYYHPNLRYTSAYNDQLLPQLLGTRYRDLLLKTTPDLKINPESVEVADAYARIIGVEYIFLPYNSPYIEPLINTLGYRSLGTVTGEEYRLTILSPPWQPAYAALVTDAESKSIQAAKIISLPMADGYFTELDKVIQQMAAIKYGPNSKLLKIEFPAPDKVVVRVPAINMPQHIYLNQSYSEGWKINGGAITKTADNMMLLSVPAGVGVISLTHSWGYLPYIQFVLWGLIGLYLGFVFIRSKRRV